MPPGVVASPRERSSGPPALLPLFLFSAAERDLVRREMGLRFGQPPSLAEGLLLRTWRGGPHADDATLRDGAMPALAGELLKFAPEGPEVGDLALDLRQVS
jgi:hypothetical protein